MYDAAASSHAHLRLIKQFSKAPCTENVTFGIYPGERRFWVQNWCVGSFQCHDRRHEWCGAISWASGTNKFTSARQNCSCLTSPKRPRDGPRQHPKPPWDDRILRNMRLAKCPGSSCPPPGKTKRVLVMEGAKEDAAFGNLFFSMIANFLLYVGHKGLVPQIQFNPRWVAGTMGTAWAEGGGTLWEQFFAPYCPNVSAWAAACPNVQYEPLKPKTFYYPGVQKIYRWSIHQWYDQDSPQWRTCDWLDTCGQFNASAFASWRLRAHAALLPSHHVNEAIAGRLDALRQEFNPNSDGPILGVHMRGSDKRSGRKPVYPESFWPYVRAFGERFSRGRIYIATESTSYAQRLAAWNESLGGRVFAQPIQTRVDGRRGNFRVHPQLAVARDVLLDILMLSQADYLLHGASAVAEAAIYLSPSLHWRSTHLEYEHSGCVSTSSCHDAPWAWEHKYGVAGYLPTSAVPTRHAGASGRMGRTRLQRMRADPRPPT